MTRSHALREGLRDAAPILPGILPFGIIAGAAAVSAGLAPMPAAGFSAIVFAGASQLAAVELLAQQATWPVILLTILVINLRFVMYSAVLAPWLSHLPLRIKAVLAYLITDQAFAVTVARQRRRPDAAGLPWYYFGAAISLWLTWQTGTVVGVLVGSLVPASWHLDFSVPLAFLALLVPLVSDRASLVTAGVAGAVALVGRGLPWNLGLIVAAVVGIAVGLLVENRTRAVEATESRRSAA